MTTQRLILLIILGVCIAASGYLSGSETAMMALPRERLHQLERKGRRGRHLAALASEPDRLLGTLLVANNFVNILAASVATTLAIDLISASWGRSVGDVWGPWAATLVITSVILVVGEITPKTLAARSPDRFALAVTPGIWSLSRVIAPVARVFLAVSRVVLRLLGADRGTAHEVTVSDIRALVSLGEKAGEIEVAEREIIDAVLGLEDRPVREVVTPRLEVVALSEPVTEEKVRRAVAATGHSRYPVVQEGGSLDDLVGILYVKDLFRPGPELGPVEIKRLIREPHYVPESASILTTLHELRARRVGFAMVLDEHGGVEGMVTIKDLVSELVGELQDEYDPGAPSIIPTDRNVWLAEGRLPVEDLADVLGYDLPAGPYTTAGGLFLAAAGAIPKEGDHVTFDRLRLTVTRMDRRRIDQLRVEQLPEPAGRPAG